MTFKEDTEHLGLGQESGECSMFTEEETGEGKLSGEREEWDEDSDECSENQDSVCMILAEEKTRHHDRELQTDPSSGTYNLDVQEIRGGEELEKIDLNNAMFRIRNPDRRYAIKPVNLIMANEIKAPVFLSRRVRLKANEAAIVGLRMKNYNELSDNKQVCIVPNPNSQSAAVLGRSFSITKSGLFVSVLLNTLDIPITIQRGRKLGYALPVKTRYETTENSKQNEVVDCPNHRDKICILRRLQKIKDSSGLVKSLKSETDDGLSSCSNFPERPTLDEIQTDKPVLPEIEHLRGKLKDEQLEAIKDVLERNEEVFSRHKADIGCCIFLSMKLNLRRTRYRTGRGRGA